MAPFYFQNYCNALIFINDITKDEPLVRAAVGTADPDSPPIEAEQSCQKEEDFENLATNPNYKKTKKRKIEKRESLVCL